MVRVRLGNALNYNVGVQRAYIKRLTFMIDVLSKEVVQFVKTNYTFDAKDLDISNIDPVIVERFINYLYDKYGKEFEDKGQDAVRLMVYELLKISAVNIAANLKKVFKRTDVSAMPLSANINTDFMLESNYFAGELKDYTKAAIAENVSLIKSIPEEYLTKVQRLIYRSLTSGESSATLVKKLSKFTAVSKRRVELLALDQTRKLYAKVNAYRMQKLGAKKFEWIHSGGGREPRLSHMAMSGKIYSFDDLPIINKDNKHEPPQRGLPGEAPNCRCVIGFVYEFE